LENETLMQKQQKAERIAQEFNNFMTEWHSYNQPYDDEMDADIHERYARVLNEQNQWGYFDFQRNPDGKKRPFFSPSNAGISDRELYERARGSKRDPVEFTTNQRWWIGLGTVIGDYIQREILLAERHFRKLTGKTPPFIMKRKDNGDPMYEHFVKKMHEVEHDGEAFAYFGLPDGILEYTDEETGEIIDVGLEVKSEQSNWSRFRQLNAPKHGHLAQTTMYSDMYGFDYVIIAYVLSYGRGWFEEFNRLKTFGKYVSEDERLALRQRCADATRNAREGNAPAFDLIDWKFTDYKTAIATGLTDEEFEELRNLAIRAKKSNIQTWKKQAYATAIEEIEEIRREEGMD